MRKTSRFITYSLAVSGAIVLTLVGGWLLTPSINTPYQAPTTAQPDRDKPAAAESVAVEIHARFQKGVSLMLAGEYREASETWTSLLAMKPDFPEAHTNLGFSLMEIGQHHRACEHFNQATRINSYQLNAYYGLATCLEALGDLPGALGAMRAFVHLSPEDDPFLRKANAAIWEWQGIIDAGNNNQAAAEGDANNQDDEAGNEKSGQ